MDYLDNDFLIPVILGGGQEAEAVSRIVYAKTSVYPHLFCTSFSFRQRLLCKCKKLPQNSDVAKLGELLRFADNNEPQGSLLLIYTKENEQFFNLYKEDIESRYVAVRASELISFRKDTD